MSKVLQSEVQMRDQRWDILRELGAGGTACMTASGALNPMDVVKTRLQAQNPVNRTYHSFSDALRTILKEEGLVRGLYTPGLLASLIREGSYSSIRMGLYPWVKSLFANENGGDVGFLRKFLAGLMTGALGSGFANPTDLVKIRMQVDSGVIRDGVFVTGVRKGQAPQYANTFHAFKQIFREGGFRALYVGVEVTMLRAALLTAGQMSSYDHSKHLIKKWGILEEGMPLHITGSLISGLVATTASIPADVIKTRIMNDNTGKYRNSIHCLFLTVRHEGPRALLKGWVPAYLRLGPHFIVSLPLYEQMRKVFGLATV